MKRFKQKVIRFTAVFLAVNILIDTVFATLALALTSGPSSPEFASFEPVATTNMVNTFTGDFTYNLPVLQIPGPDGGGYAMSLAYHSGANSEEEASWVGYGWTLNPGSINRNVRGFPDDYKGVPIKQFNKIPVNWTASATLGRGLKYFGKKKFKIPKEIANPRNLEPFMTYVDSDLLPDVEKAKLSLNYTRTLRYNNYTGLMSFYGIGGSAFGFSGLDMKKSAKGRTWNAKFNPLKAIYKIKKGFGVKVHKAKEGKHIKINHQFSSSSLTQSLRGALGAPFSTKYGLYTFSERIKNV
ncbi:hypothetical protein [uncultured Microscilla sp.]|uniref:hypothetical protein n=1 Tax=uncultured Microscilla sp. TaxID=432653 RepID=UPI00262242BB|nr:hypothetical protein [uncultured Microscilla sp.]